MGYSTEFTGSFKLDRPLDGETLSFLTKLARTRRMKRNIEGFGVEGEFYVDGSGDFGQGQEDNIINYNEPPATQPGLWCQWVPSKDGTRIEWDGGEKFYRYREWIQYIIERVLRPRGYSLNGQVNFQ
ncbi:MAG: hypothetical protein EBZ48_06620, partial [Proteobacteria bacterium]|nr:hypothetical protein [Pseudomonadota bacterium]